MRRSSFHLCFESTSDVSSDSHQNTKKQRTQTTVVIRTKNSKRQTQGTYFSPRNRNLAWPKRFTEFLFDAGIRTQVLLSASERGSLWAFGSQTVEPTWSPFLTCWVKWIWQIYRLGCHVECIGGFVCRHVIVDSNWSWLSDRWSGD